MGNGERTTDSAGRNDGIAFAVIATLIVVTAVTVVWTVGGQFLERWGELTGQW